MGQQAHLQAGLLLFITSSLLVLMHGRLPSMFGREEVLLDAHE
jgi:hypothetical protein